MVHELYRNEAVKIKKKKNPCIHRGTKKGGEWRRLVKESSFFFFFKESSFLHKNVSK